VLPRNPRRLKLKLFPPFAAFCPVSRAMMFLPLLSGVVVFLTGLPQRLSNWSELHFAALPQARG
jgi:hypothetical protein